MTSSPATHIPNTVIWRPLPVSVLDGVNKSSPTVTVTVNQENCYPCRKCLCDGKLGEKMRLLSYDPFLGDSPHRQPGPIFLHESPKCDLAEFDETPTVVPEQQRKRLLSVRAYDKHHMMMGADVTEGTQLLQRAELYFNNDSIDYLHVHYAMPGCFALRVDRGKVI